MGCSGEFRWLFFIRMEEGDSSCIGYSSNFLTEIFGDLFICLQDDDTAASSV